MRTRVLVGLLLVLGAAPAGPASAAESWVWPVEGPRTVVRPFAPPETRYGPGHRGADVAADVGAAVRAAGAGRIAYAGLLAGRGVVVVVHGELRTTYEPVAAAVRVGQVVAAGAVIGRLTAGGHCACLHWGLLRGEVYLDPVQLVRRGPSRLLPVDGGVPPPAGALLRGGETGPVEPVRSAEPVDSPRLALRSGQAPWGLTALVALVVGLALLLRPRSGPRRPPAAPAAAAVPVPPVDLAAERTRRRSA